jgi:hypothetical protein
MIAAVAFLRGHNPMTCTNDPKVTNYRCRIKIAGQSPPRITQRDYLEIDRFSTGA